MYKYFLTTLYLIVVTGCATTKPLSPEKSSVSKPIYKEVLATDLNYDAPTGRIHYVLPQDAVCRIRIGTKQGGAMVRTLIDWEPRATGSHDEVWDKKDESGTILFGDNSNYMLVLSCMTESKENSNKNNTPPAVRGIRKSPQLEISFPDTVNSHENLPSLKGVVPVRVKVSDADKSWMTKSKYEVAFFFDSIYLFEDEEGTSPYTYQLNTQGVNPGEHVLTVNLVGYDGEVGTRSVKVWIE